MSFIIVKLRDEIADNKVDENYLNWIFKSYRQLTDAPNISWYDFRHIVTNLPPLHEIYVYKIDDNPVALVTLIVEQKLIHSGSRVGHIEDLVVDEAYQGQGIAKRLIEYCINNCRVYGSYKVILDCRPELVDFYKGNNFEEGGAYMFLKMT